MARLFFLVLLFSAYTVRAGGETNQAVRLEPGTTLTLPDGTQAMINVRAYLLDSDTFERLVAAAQGCAQAPLPAPIQQPQAPPGQQQTIDPGPPTGWIVASAASLVLASTALAVALAR